MADGSHLQPIDGGTRSAVRTVLGSDALQTAREGLKAARRELQHREWEFSASVRDRLDSTSVEIGSDFAMLVQRGEAIYAVARQSFRTILPSTAYEHAPVAHSTPPWRAMERDAPQLLAALIMIDALDGIATGEAIKVMEAAAKVAHVEAELALLQPPPRPFQPGSALRMAA